MKELLMIGLAGYGGWYLGKNPEVLKNLMGRMKRNPQPSALPRSKSVVPVQLTKPIKITPFGLKMPTLRDCGRPHTLSELPGLARHVRQFPVEMQQISFDRNLLENYYDY